MFFNETSPGIYRKWAGIYRSMGWSVIPVYGNADSDRAKAPPIRWSRYRFTPPTPDEIECWFDDTDYGLAVVCGSVSRLAVLDFDDADLAAQFAADFPDLANTWTVRSGGRGLPHYYLRIPDGITVQGRSVPGLDLRGEGGYVVAPPTRVGSQVWEIAQDTQPRTLSHTDVRRVLQFVNSAGAAKPTAPALPPTPAVPVVTPASNTAMTGGDLIEIYKRLAPAGRNNALFRASRLARDVGWKEEAVRSCLAMLHATQAQADEQLQKRYQEAVRTIRSAFTRPPTQSRKFGLHNRTREWLLQRSRVSAARVLDGLYLAGVEAGAALTERAVWDALKPFGIGRRAVMEALSTDLPDGRLFVSPPYPPFAEKRASDHLDRDKECDSDRGVTRVKNRGRPARGYLVPSPEEVARRLGLRTGVRDVLKAEDLSSGTHYRQALYRALYERRPGQYPRRWLARRLGISKWTSRRYDKALKVYAQPMYEAQPVILAMASRLKPAGGVFLEDARGKRYPALPEIAERLLARGMALQLKRQGPNFYACSLDKLQFSHSQMSPERMEPVFVPRAVQKVEGISTPIAAAPQPVTEAAWHQRPLPAGEPRSRKSFWLCPHCLNFHICETPPDACDRCGAGLPWQHIDEAIWRNTERVKAWWQRLWRAKYPNHKRLGAAPAKRASPKGASYAKPLPDPAHEALAEHTQQQARGLSLPKARELVARYGVEPVRRGLQTLASRLNIFNPAGFLIVLLRSEAKFAPA
jgi:hypothetical protein